MSPTILRYVRGLNTWALVSWRGLDHEAEAHLRGLSEDPAEFFKGGDNAPPIFAMHREIWEWRGTLSETDDDIGEWHCVGVVESVEDGE